ncbi:MAG: alpha-amylase family glycosyl hydrolase [Succinivibrio sp.]
MRQNTSSQRATLPFQCFHTCSAPDVSTTNAVLFVRGANHNRLKISIVTFSQNEDHRNPMNYTGSFSGIHRFEAPLTLGNDKSQNLVTYYFKIALCDNDGKVVDVVWYSSLGMSREPPLMQHCYAIEMFNTHPQWAIDTVIYQIFPDKFASSSGFFNVDGTKVATDAPIKLKDFEFINLDETHCGGDLDGVASMLPYIRSLGCDTIYMTPIFKAASVHKFDTEDYDMVDPHFGGNGALKRLRTVALGYEMKIVLHGTFNHTGDTHSWFDRQERTGKGALRHKDSPFRDFYTFTSDGEPYVSDGKANYPKLDYANYPTQHAMFDGTNAVVKKWTRAPYGIDGWVIDDANQIGDNGTARNNRKRLAQICKSARDAHLDCLMIGQFGSDPRYAICSEGNVDGTINYTGFISPIRAFFGGINLNGDPTPYSGEDLRRTCEEFSVGVSQQVKLCLINQLDNYKIDRFYSIIGGDKYLYLAALACLFTWRGIPCVYQGDELGDVIEKYEVGPRSMIPYTALKDRHASVNSNDIQNVISELASLRNSNPAFTRGSMLFICSGGAYFGYLRLYEDRFSIVFVNASRQQVKVEQGSMLFPLLSTMFMPEDCGTDDSEDTGEDLLIPLSGRNVRRVDHGEGLEGLYEMLSREKLAVKVYGSVRTSAEFEQKFLKELCSAKNIVLPPRSTVVISNSKK